MSGRPVVSVVVPTRGRPGALKRCLESLARQDYPIDAFEIVVIDDGSPQPVTLPELGSGVSFTLHRQAQGGPAAARNHGLEHARGEYVAFIDDDCEASPDWLRRAGQHSAAASGRRRRRACRQRPGTQPVFRGQPGAGLVPLRVLQREPRGRALLHEQQPRVPARCADGGRWLRRTISARRRRGSRALRSLATPGPAARHRTGCANPSLAQPHAARLLAPALLLRHGRMALLAASCQRPVQRVSKWSRSGSTGVCSRGRSGRAALRACRLARSSPLRRWPTPPASSPRRCGGADLAWWSERHTHAELKRARIANRRDPVERRHGTRRIRTRAPGVVPGQVVDAIADVEGFDEPVQLHRAADAERAAQAQVQREEVAARSRVPRNERDGRTSKFGGAVAPSASGRLVVPCRLATPDVMLNGSAE